MTEEFMVINLATAEVEPGFKSREQAEEFVKEVNIPEVTQEELDNDIDFSEEPRTLIMPSKQMEVPEDVEDVLDMFEFEEHPELILYPNADRNRMFSKVAEYFEDTLNEDFISTQDLPVNYVVAA
jgi:hypothetical protein